MILTQEAVDRWLRPDVDAGELLTLLGPREEGLTAHPVSTLVNAPRNDEPRCIERVE